MRKFKALLVIVMLIAIASTSYAAVSTNTIFSNVSPGEGFVISNDIYSADASPKYAAGTQKSYADGRIFRYTHFGADTNRGLIVAQDISESASLSASGLFTVIATASVQNSGDNVVGSKYVEATAAGVTAGQFAGGYLSVVDGTGEGYTYRIKYNTATDDPTTGTMRFELYDKLQATLAATTDISVVGSMYADVEGATAATDMFVCGISMATMDVSEAAYGWVQTHGVSSVLIDGSVTAGDIVTLSDGVTGAVQLQDAYTEQIVGYCLDPAQSGAHGSIYLQID